MHQARCVGRCAVAMAAQGPRPAMHFAAPSPWQSVVVAAVAARRSGDDEALVAELERIGARLLTASGAERAELARELDTRLGAEMS